MVGASPRCGWRTPPLPDLVERGAELRVGEDQRERAADDAAAVDDEDPRLAEQPPAIRDVGRRQVRWVAGQDGLELLTYYPRDLESLTIPA